MPKIVVTKRFPFSPDGCRVVQVEKGPQEVSERCAEIALGEGWAELPAPVPSKKSNGPTNKELAEKLKALGGEVPKRATKEQLLELIEQAEAEAAKGGEGE